MQSENDCPIKAGETERKLQDSSSIEAAGFAEILKHFRKGAVIAMSYRHAFMCPRYHLPILPPVRTGSRPAGCVWYCAGQLNLMTPTANVNKPVLWQHHAWKPLRHLVISQKTHLAILITHQRV